MLMSFVPKMLDDLHYFELIKTMIIKPGILQFDQPYPNINFYLFGVGILQLVGVIVQIIKN